MENKECEYAKLVEYKRNGLNEQVHFGIILYMNKKGIIKKIGNDNNCKFYMRSCMKPMQISPLIDLGIDKKYNLTLEEIAVCCASHTGDEIHREKILSILTKTGFSENDLLCPPLAPLSKKEKIKLLLNSESAGKIHNNCSGKHSAMLAVCKEKGFCTANYKDIDNPLTEYIINKVCTLCEISKNDIIISKDGCGLPVIAAPLENLGRGFLNLFTDKKYEKITKAFLNYPYLTGGEDRLDSEIINASYNIIAKAGAGGLIVIVNLSKQECVVIKIADSDAQARSITAIDAMLKLKWLKPHKLSVCPLNNLYNKEIKSQDNEILGSIETCFNI